MRHSNLRTLQKLSSMVVVAFCSGAVLLPVVLVYYTDDRIMRKEDYPLILQLHLKSAARCVEHGHNWIFQQDNDLTHIKLVSN